MVAFGNNFTNRTFCKTGNITESNSSSLASRYLLDITETLSELKIRKTLTEKQRPDDDYDGKQQQQQQKTL